MFNFPLLWMSGQDSDNANAGRELTTEDRQSVRSLGKVNIMDQCLNTIRSILVQIYMSEAMVRYLKLNEQVRFRVGMALLENIIIVGAAAAVCFVVTGIEVESMVYFDAVQGLLGVLGLFGVKSLMKLCHEVLTATIGHVSLNC